MMSDNAKKAQAKYIKKWRAKNKDKVAQYNANYWERVAKQSNEDMQNETENSRSK